MAECLARFAMRVSRAPGACSAVKLNCISPMPISTTPDTTIVQVTRERIRFPYRGRSQAAVVHNSSLQLRDRKENTSSLKKLEGPKPARICGPRRLLSSNSRSHTSLLSHGRNLPMPLSQSQRIHARRLTAPRTLDNSDAEEIRLQCFTVKRVWKINC